MKLAPGNQFRGTFQATWQFCETGQFHKTAKQKSQFCGTFCENKAVS